MSKFLKWVGWTGLIVLVGSLIVGAAVLGLTVEGLQEAGNWHVVVDGEDVFDGPLSSLVHVPHGPLGWLGAALACGFTLLVMVPLSLLLGLGLPLMILVAVFGGLGLLMAGLSLVAFGPLLLPLLLVWWLATRRRKAAQPTA